MDPFYVLLISELVVRILLAIGICVGTFVPETFYRVVPVSQWYQYSLPYSEETHSILMTTITVAITFVVVVICSGLGRKYLAKMDNVSVLKDLALFILGFSLCVMMTLGIIQFVKTVYGALRPCFLSCCTGTNDTSLMRNMPKYEMYSDLEDCCRNNWFNGVCTPTNSDCLAIMTEEFPRVPDCNKIIHDSIGIGDIHEEWHEELDDMRKSFPSGHSGMTFTSFLFMGLYVGRLTTTISRGIWTNPLWFTVVAVFMIWPIVVCIYRSRDYRHHPVDIIAGATLGSAAAIVCYLIYFPGYELKTSAMTEHILDRDNSVRLCKYRNEDLIDNEIEASSVHAISRSEI